MKKKTADIKAYMKAYREKNRLKINEQKRKTKKEEKPEPVPEVPQYEPPPIPTQPEPIPEPVQEPPPPPPAQDEPTADTQSKTTNDFFANLKNNYKKTEEPTAPEEKQAEPAQGESVQEEIKEKSKITPNADTQTLITGYLFLLAVNSVYPDILLWMLSRASKKYRGLDADNISLDETELQMIEPIADEVVRIYLPKLNPLLLLFIAMNAMYFGNIKKEFKNKKRNTIKI
jgi:hypothetical protein